MLHQNISYGMTKLLKPLVSIQNPDNPFLSYLEMGAFDPKVRYLIGMGIPRETAIRISEFGLLSNFEPNNYNDNEISATMRKLKDSKKLSYWYRIQLEDYY